MPLGGSCLSRRRVGIASVPTDQTLVCRRDLEEETEPVGGVRRRRSSIIGDGDRSEHIYRLPGIQAKRSGRRGAGDPASARARELDGPRRRGQRSEESDRRALLVLSHGGEIGDPHVPAFAVSRGQGQGRRGGCSRSGLPRCPRDAWHSLWTWRPLRPSGTGRSRRALRSLLAGKPGGPGHTAWPLRAADPRHTRRPGRSLRAG